MDDVASSGCRELYRNNFEGKIPEELGNLKSLISLDLYENRLQGEIPKSFAKLKSLRFFIERSVSFVSGMFQTMTFVEPFQLMDHLQTFLFRGNDIKFLCLLTKNVFFGISALTTTVDLMDRSYKDLSLMTSAVESNTCTSFEEDNVIW
ncbi:hypothetical protein BHE74_00029006 [Ensete ventricosum]|nr:hypothetical protein BHE74_00029006 [Ensete ventricosum]